MIANVADVITIGVGLAVGTWALVRLRWPGNGRPHADSPPEQPSPGKELERITGRLDRILEQQAAFAHGHTPWDPSIPPIPPGGGGGRRRTAMQPSGPGPRAVDITLSMFNTFFLVAGEIYTLIPPESGSHNINVANLGPGNLFMRADADPSPGDPQSETLPAGAVDNLIHIPQSLRVTVDIDSFVSARLGYQ